MDKALSQSLEAYNNDKLGDTKKENRIATAKRVCCFLGFNRHLAST
jgi:hypothetical protein